MKGLDVDLPECQSALRELEAFLDRPGGEPPAPALAHVAGCPRCQARLAFFARALAQPAADRLTCDECEADLPWFLSAEGAQVGARGRRVAVHLATCPRCAAVYGELLAMDRAAWEAAPAPAPTPRPRLAFLRREPAASPWSYLLGQLRVELAGLFGPAAQPLALAGNVKSAAAPEAARELRSPAGLAPDLQATVTCQPVAMAAARCSLVVNADIPSRGGWPRLRGTRVMLKRGEALVEERETDAFGKAVFQNLPIAELAELAVVVAPSP